MGGSIEAQIRDYLQNRPRSELLNVRKKLARLEAMDLLKSLDRQPALPLEFTSQYGEDCWLWELFAGQVDGFFVEVGAFDGYRYSVSYPFEAVGWKGLLIEPIPARCQEALKRRPGSRVVNAALGPPGGPPSCTFTVVGNDGDFGMLSYLTPTAVNTADVKSVGASTSTVTVPLTTMNDLLAGHQGPIDFAVIDVEGGEIPLLQGFDLARFRPRVLLIEEGLPSPSSNISRYMSAFPYTAAAFPWINRAYIRNDETELIARAKQVPIW